MHPLLRFNLLFLPSLLAATFAVGFLVRGALHRRGESEVLQNARMMMEAAKATRTYTTKQIAPLIDTEREKVEQAAKEQRQTLGEQLPAVFQAVVDRASNPKEKTVLAAAQRTVLDGLRQEAARHAPPTVDFYPQSIPAYATTEVFALFRARYPQFFYKEAVLNPTNLRDRAVEWEADIVNSFRASAGESGELVGRRATPVGEALFLAWPIQIKERSCLVCHSVPEAAPPQMLRSYGSEHGFGWKFDETIGAQIVSVPVALARGSADAVFHDLLVPGGGIFGALFLLGNIGAWLGMRRGAGTPL